MTTKWARYRDHRLVHYDDTLELMLASGIFSDAERRVIPNIVELSPREVALFFLSTSYVTRYVDRDGGTDYVETFIRTVQDIDHSEAVKINCDVHAFVGER